MKPRALAALLLTALVLLALLGGVGWYFSDRVLVPAPYAMAPEFEIVGVEGDGIEGDGEELEVTLPAPPDDPPQYARTRAEGVYALLWGDDAPGADVDGYGRLGPVAADDGARVVRPLTDLVGDPPRPGDGARLDATVFRRDPLADHGIPFETVALRSDVDLSGWWIEGESRTAVLMLHGRRRGERTETLRILPTLVAMDYPVLALAHRNHRGSADAPDGLYRYGASEWADALAGAAFLRERGADRVVIYAFSYGALLALEALERWPDPAPDPVALVLDSPLLDPRTVVRRGAENLGLPLPGALTELALLVGRLRTGVRWSGLDARSSAADLTLPLLLFAGTADGTIPVDLVDDFADRVRAPLDYRRLEGVEHVEGWNVDPESYENAVRAFLLEHAPPGVDTGAGDTGADAGGRSDRYAARSAVAPSAP